MFVSFKPLPRFSAQYPRRMSINRATGTSTPAGVYTARVTHAQLLDGGIISKPPRLFIADPNLYDPTLTPKYLLELLMTHPPEEKEKQIMTFIGSLLNEANEHGTFSHVVPRMRKFIEDKRYTFPPEPENHDSWVDKLVYTALVQKDWETQSRQVFQSVGRSMR